MTVSEFIAALAAYPGDTPVLARIALSRTEPGGAFAAPVRILRMRDAGREVLVVAPTGDGTHVSADGAAPDPVAPGEPTHPYVSRHALERFREHAPDAEWPDVLAALERGIDVPPETATALAGRPKSHPHGDSRYRLAPDRAGLFVLAPKRHGTPGWSVVTFLRFGPAQAAFARAHWPEGEAA